MKILLVPYKATLVIPLMTTWGSISEERSCVSPLYKTEQSAPLVGQSGITTHSRPSPQHSIDDGSFVTTADQYAHHVFRSGISTQSGFKPASKSCRGQRGRVDQVLVRFKVLKLCSRVQDLTATSTQFFQFHVTLIGLFLTIYFFIHNLFLFRQQSCLVGFGTVFTYKLQPSKTFAPLKAPMTGWKRL